MPSLHTKPTWRSLTCHLLMLYDLDISKQLTLAKKRAVWVWKQTSYPSTLPFRKGKIQKVDWQKTFPGLKLPKVTQEDQIQQPVENNRTRRVSLGCCVFPELVFWYKSLILICELGFQLSLLKREKLCKPYILLFMDLLGTTKLFLDMQNVREKLVPFFAVLKLL